MALYPSRNTSTDWLTQAVYTGTCEAIRQLHRDYDFTNQSWILEVSSEAGSLEAVQSSRASWQAADLTRPQAGSAVSAVSAWTHPLSVGPKDMVKCKPTGLAVSRAGGCDAAVALIHLQALHGPLRNLPGNKGADPHRHPDRAVVGTAGQRLSCTWGCYCWVATGTSSGID